MKTLEEVIKELGLKPNDLELSKGRSGNNVHISNDNLYVTFYDNYLDVLENIKVIEVKPEWT